MIKPEEIKIQHLPSVDLLKKDSLPKLPGIYFAIDSLDRVQYIGQSENLYRRWLDHSRYSDFKRIGKVRIAYLFISSKELLPQVEAALIYYFNPSLNSYYRQQHEDVIRHGNLLIKFKQMRKKRGFSQTKMAQMLGISVQAWQSIENGKSKGINLARLDKLCEILECTPADILVYLPDEAIAK